MSAEDPQETAQRHLAALDVCVLLLENINHAFDCPQVISFDQVEVCLSDIYGPKSEQYMPLFNVLFKELEFVDIERLQEKIKYHTIMAHVFEERAFQAQIA